PSSGGVSSTWNNGGDLDGTDFLTFAVGDLFVTSYYNDQVVVFDGTTGNFLGSFNGSGHVLGITTANSSVSAVAFNGMSTLNGTGSGSLTNAEGTDELAVVM